MSLETIASLSDKSLVSLPDVAALPIPAPPEIALITTTSPRHALGHEFGGAPPLTNDIHEAQADMRVGYFSGGAGILASSLAWMVAAFIAWRFSTERAVWALFAGGVLIHPVSIVLCKLFGARGSHTKGNPLASLVGANTVWLIFCLPLAYTAYLQRPEWFFPAMLLVIGGRYLTFALLYGLRLYWALGLILAGGAYAVAASKAAPTCGALFGGTVELIFAVVVLAVHSRWRGGSGSRNNASSGAVGDVDPSGGTRLG